MKKFTVDLNKGTTGFPHYWELCVGSCHGYTALRQDYREQLKKVKEELGFRYVRFHGLFDDDMCVCTEPKDHFGQSQGIRYNFFNTDSIFDFLLSIGMKPFIEIGFMPSCLASGETTCFHYKGNVTPPRDYKLWNEFIHAFTSHCVERYGLEEVKEWFFEVWNEPNLPFFFDGTQEQYFQLYENTANSIKAVNKDLRVGGPATSINAWIPEFIAYCEGKQVPLDFVSTHHYPTDDPLWKNADMSMQEFFTTMGDQFGKYERGIIRKMTEKASREAGKYPLYYTEWNTSAMTNDAQHDECYASAMIAKILADNDGLVKGYSYWTFTDIFEEGGQLKGPFHGGFGLQNVYGVEKPAYRLFQLFHGLGTRRLVVETQGESTVELLAVKTETGLRLLAHNHNVPGEPIEAQQVEIDLKGFAPVTKLSLAKIDQDHCNPKKAWEAMGCPEYLNDGQIQSLRQASQLSWEEGTLSFTVEPHGVVAVDVEVEIHGEVEADGVQHQPSETESGGELHPTFSVAARRKGVRVTPRSRQD